MSYSDGIYNVLQQNKPSEKKVMLQPLNALKNI